MSVMATAVAAIDVIAVYAAEAAVAVGLEGIALTVGSTVAGALEGAMIGAAIGGAVAGVSGGNIGKGMLQGGMIGGVTGGAMAGFSGGTAAAPYGQAASNSATLVDTGITTETIPVVTEGGSPASSAINDYDNITGGASITSDTDVAGSTPASATTSSAPTAAAPSSAAPGTTAYSYDGAGNPLDKYGDPLAQTPASTAQDATASASGASGTTGVDASASSTSVPSSTGAAGDPGGTGGTGGTGGGGVKQPPLQQSWVDKHPVMASAAMSGIGGIGSAYVGSLSKDKELQQQKELAQQAIDAKRTTGIGTYNPAKGMISSITPTAKVNSQRRINDILANSMPYRTRTA